MKQGDLCYQFTAIPEFAELFFFAEFAEFADFFPERCATKTRSCGVLKTYFSRSYIYKRRNKQRSRIVAMFWEVILSQWILQIYEGKQNNAFLES